MSKMALKTLSEEDKKDQLLNEIVEKLFARNEAGKIVLDSVDYSNQLKERLNALQVQNELKVGDIVKWKSGLKNKKKPDYGVPSIVVEVLDKPIYDEENQAGSPYFKEPLDLLLGSIDDDGDFNVYHYDKRRFTK
jgi:hypothetical protein